MIPNCRPSRTDRSTSIRLSMAKGIHFALVLIVSVTLSTRTVVAGDTTQADRAVKAITAILPKGWSVAKQKPGEFPYGHHWNENYTGPKGLLVVVTGTRPVHAEFIAPNGESNVVHVATESLDILLMPGNYSNSRLAWLDLDRPIQPTTIIGRGPIKVYAEPSHLLLSEKRFKELLSDTNGIAWVDSPFDSPQLLTWQDWRSKLKKAIEGLADK